jgi:uncharacterized protein (DUF302 family)
VAGHSSTYGFGQQVNLPYGEAVERTKEALKTEGFGVPCEIDVQKTLKEKLEADFHPYVILGACNPLLVHQALKAELYLGLLLPCNVVVYSSDQATFVKAMDLEPVLGLVGNPALALGGARARWLRLHEELTGDVGVFARVALLRLRRGRPLDLPLAPLLKRVIHRRLELDLFVIVVPVEVGEAVRYRAQPVRFDR